MAFTVDDILLEWTDASPKKGVSLSIDAGLYEGYYVSIDAYLFAHPSEEISLSMDAYLMPSYNFNTWARTDVIIPSASIDADLTGFPLLLHLSDSAGTTSADCTHLFESMRYPSFSKDYDFTGTDGDPPDSTLWTVSDPGGYISIQSNALQFSCPASINTLSYVEFKFPAYNNFDVQMDFNITSYSASYNSSAMKMVGLRALHRDNPAGYYSGGSIARAVSYTNDCLAQNQKQASEASTSPDNWTTGTITATETAISTGKLRLMAFSGMVIWALYSGSEWGWFYGNTWIPWTTQVRPFDTYLAAADDFNEVNDKQYGPWTIQIFFEQKSGHSTPLTVNVDNFTWNKPGDLNIYNMAILDEDDQILPAEVVDVETESGSEAIWLYTTVPTVSSSSDTTLRIYTTNDPDIDPNPFIGHQCQTASVRCWPDGLSICNQYGMGGETAQERVRYQGLSYAIYPYYHESYHRHTGLGFYATGPAGANPYDWATVGSTYIGPFGPESVYPDTMGAAFTLEFVINLATVPSSWCTLIGTGWDDGTIYTANCQVGWTVRCDNEEVYLYFSPNGSTGYHNYFDWTPSADTDYHFMVVWETDQYPIVYVNGSALTRTTDVYIPTIYRPMDEWARLRQCVSSDGQFNYPTSGSKLSAVHLIEGAKSAAWHTATYEAQTDTLVSYDVHIRQVGIDSWLENDVDFAEEIAAASSTSAINLSATGPFSTTISASSSAGEISMTRILRLAARSESWGVDTSYGVPYFQSWETWRTSGDAVPEIMGGSYGSVIIPSGESIFSPVMPLRSNIFYTDFSEYTIGVAPGDWSEEWTASVFSINMSAGDIGGKELYIDMTSANRAAAVWDTVGDVVDVETIAKIQWTSGSDYNIGAGARLSGGTSETGYGIFFRDSTDDISLRRYVSGGVTELENYSISLAADTYYWIRSKFVGSNIKVRVWADGGAEPSVWHIDYDDASPVSGSGGVGLVDYSTDGWCDYFLATTDVSLYTNRIDLQHQNLGSHPENYTIYIRGSSIPFSQLAASPTWEEYTEPIDRDWIYVQIKIVG